MNDFLDHWKSILLYLGTSKWARWGEKQSNLEMNGSEFKVILTGEESDLHGPPFFCSIHAEKRYKQIENNSTNVDSDKSNSK